MPANTDFVAHTVNLARSVAGMQCHWDFAIAVKRQLFLHSTLVQESFLKLQDALVDGGEDFLLISIEPRNSSRL